MPTDVLFTELFPIQTDAIPPLTAYALSDRGPFLGGKLAYYLGQTVGGIWFWADERLVTDTPVTAVELNITRDILREQQPNVYGGLGDIEEDSAWRPSALALARYVVWRVTRDLEALLMEAVAKPPAVIGSAHIERSVRLEAWVAGAGPALSIGVQSQLVVDSPLSDYVAGLDKPKAAIGMWAKDRTSGFAGEVVALVGRLGEHRARLMALTKRDAMRDYLRDAPDDEWVARLQAGERSYDYPCGVLTPIIRAHSDEDFRMWGLPAEAARAALRLSPPARARYIRAASDVLKARGFIGNAYNSRTHPHLFYQRSLDVELVFGDGRARPYRPETLGEDFMRGGVYWRHPRYADSPIRIASINTLDEPIDDFMTALQRQLERTFGYSIVLIKERKVRVLNEKNLESAVRVVEKETPHILLAFLPDASDDEEALDRAYVQLKSLSLGRGMASHIIRRHTMHNPAAMASIIMALLGKTGSVPFALAEPLAYADALVGLDMVREAKKDHDRLVTMARIYNHDGQLARYIAHEVEVDSGAPIPLIAMQTVFPLEIFAQKRVVIHKLGALSEAERGAVMRWATVLKAAFYLVELGTRPTPRLYQLEGGKISGPPWGSALLLGEREALLATAGAGKAATPRPLWVRGDGHLALEHALHSVLVGTILHYGMAWPAKLPVTVQSADDLGGWLVRGLLPAQGEGDIPFWL